MLTATEYRKRLRKVVTLPSGGEVEIRKLSAADFLSVGEIPLAFQEAIRSGDRAVVESQLKANADLSKRFNTAVLVNGVVSLKIVDKDARECGEDEVSVREIYSVDQNFLMSAIFSFNSMNSEAGTSIRRFPEEPAVAGDGGRDGAAVRETAE